MPSTPGAPLLSQTLFHARMRFSRSRINSNNRSLLPRRSAACDAANSSIGCGVLFTSTHLLLITIIYLKGFPSGTVQAFSQSEASRFFYSPGSFDRPIMPSADFSCAVRTSYLFLSRNSVARDFSNGTQEISRGEHMSFGT